MWFATCRECDFILYPQLLVMCESHLAEIPSQCSLHRDYLKANMCSESQTRTRLPTRRHSSRSIMPWSTRLSPNRNKPRPPLRPQARPAAPEPESTGHKHTLPRPVKWSIRLHHWSPHLGIQQRLRVATSRSLES
jgi:hypothetical protein